MCLGSSCNRFGKVSCSHVYVKDNESKLEQLESLSEKFTPALKRKTRKCKTQHTYSAKKLAVDHPQQKIIEFSTTGESSTMGESIFQLESSQGNYPSKELGLSIKCFVILVGICL